MIFLSLECWTSTRSDGTAREQALTPSCSSLAEGSYYLILQAFCNQVLDCERDVEPFKAVEDSLSLLDGSARRLAVFGQRSVDGSDGVGGFRNCVEEVCEPSWGEVRDELPFFLPRGGRGERVLRRDSASASSASVRHDFNCRRTAGDRPCSEINSRLESRWISRLWMWSGSFIGRRSSLGLLGW